MRKTPPRKHSLGHIEDCNIFAARAGSILGSITLREIDGLSYKDIASAMSIPVGTVRSRVFRARDLIDHQLRRVYDGGLGRNGVLRSPHARSGKTGPHHVDEHALSK